MDVELALLSQVERTLFHYHSKLLGRVPRSREDYDPQQILSTLPGVDSVLVLDSLNLPENWRIGKILALGACYTGEGISCKIEAVEASEDLVTGGPTYHLLDVIKLAFIYLISCISHILALIFLVS